MKKFVILAVFTVITQASHGADKPDSFPSKTNEQETAHTSLFISSQEKHDARRIAITKEEKARIIAGLQSHEAPNDWWLAPTGLWHYQDIAIAEPHEEISTSSCLYNNYFCFTCCRAAGFLSK